MRVALVCPYSMSHPGGVQNHVLGLSQWLVQQGHEVDVLAPGQRAPGTIDERVRFTTAGKAWPVRFNGSVARISAGPIACWRTLRWLRRIDADVVHIHEPLTPSIALWALRFSTTPVVATFHTANMTPRLMGLAQKLMPRANRRIRVAIAVSASAARTSARSGARIIGNGVRVDDHSGARSASTCQQTCDSRWRGGDRPRITFIGRHDEPRKGLPVLRGAMDEILDAHPDVILDVVGQGRVVDDPRINFVGALTDAQRDDLLRRTDVYVAPNTGRESFGIILLEAMASGCRVVASDIPAFRDVLTDEDGREVGLLFEANNPHALARAVVTALDEGTADHADAARLRARRFDWDQIAPGVVECYRDAMASHDNG